MTNANKHGGKRTKLSPNEIAGKERRIYIREERREKMDKEKQYDRLIRARNFHYENLNKWLITFYAIIGALFLALWTLHKSDIPHRYMELCVAVVGYVVSVGAILSIKGYYYWEINWIMLVHHFEKVYLADEPRDMRVYSVFANQKANSDIGAIRQGANISTSKVALVITGFIAWIWGIIAIYFCIVLLPIEGTDSISCCKILFSGIASFVCTYILVLLGGYFLKSDLDNIDDLKLTKDNIDKPLQEKTQTK